MQKILVSQRLILNQHGDITCVLESKWESFLTKVNCLAIPILSHERVAEVYAATAPSGILLTGGNDLGQISNESIDQQRDLMDKALLDCAIKNRLPIIGVCRGAQFIGCHFGLDIVERPGHVTESHTIDWLESPSFCSTGRLPGSVNSYHNYCLTGQAKDLQILARAFDGTVEAFEHKGARIFACLWHPERQGDFSDFDLDLFRAIFANK